MSKPKKLDRSWNEIRTLQANLVDHFPEDRFLKKLLKGVMRVARDKANPIRGNLVASGLREVVGHVLHGLAPDEEVRSCLWFEQAADTKTVTRRQRSNYVVRAGLPDEFVKDILKLDVRGFVQPLIRSMEALSKATHVRSETIVHKGREVRAMLHDVLHGLLSLMYAAAASRNEMMRAISDVMHRAVFENLISDTIQNLDELSTHTVVTDHFIDTVKVQEMDAARISYVISGQVNVQLQYGSNSDVRNEFGYREFDSYPYRATVSSNAAKPLEIRSSDVDLKVDSSSFFE